jgi:hypothetical protein
MAKKVFDVILELELWKGERIVEGRDSEVLLSLGARDDICAGSDGENE